MNPSVAVMMLLPQCNMSCSFCVTEDTMGTFSYQQAAALLDRLKEEGFESVVIGGGEPLAWPHGLLDLTRQAKARGFLVQVGTNGILLPGGFESIDSIDRYVLPLDGATSEVHNAVRHYRDGHFQIVIDRLERLRRSGKSTTISTVITRLNQAHLPNLAALLIELDGHRPFLHAWHLYQFIPEGRGGNLHRDELQLEASEYHCACSAVKQADCRFQIFKRPDMLHSKTVEFFWMNDETLHRQHGANRKTETL
jgi:MoaA/NifB/PqqE/SkfB family radical SAM enzyme